MCLFVCMYICKAFYPTVIMGNFGNNGVLYVIIVKAPLRVCMENTTQGGMSRG